VAMLGLGTLLGYQAAWGQWTWLPSASAHGPSSITTSAVTKDCCAVPSGAALFTGGEEKAPRKGKAQPNGKEWQTPKPGNPRGATTGPTDAPGYDHPNQYMFTKPTEIAPNMEPVIVHRKQLEEATQKLADAYKKFGK